MKRCFALLLAFAILFFSCSTLAEGNMFDEMTREELVGIISQARASLAKYDVIYKEGIVIYDDNGITVSINGKRIDNAGWLYFDMTIINQSEYDIHFNLSDTYINGWKVSDSETTVFNVAAGKNARGHIRFINADKEATITDADQVTDFEFVPVVKSAKDYSVIYIGEKVNILFD